MNARHRSGMTVEFAMVGLLFLASPARAQLAGDLVKGAYGLTAGTQPPPSLVVTPWIYDSYSTSLVGPDGATLPTNGASNNVLAAPGLSLWLVTPWRLLGANYGAQLQLWGSTATLDSPRLGTSQTGYGFGDMYLKPLELGWHTTHLDIITGFALWIPTGGYVPGGDNNSGQGQWGYEFSAGATVWFDEAHHLNFAVQAFYDIYSPKSGTVTLGSTTTKLQTGNILYLQGGLGYSLLGGMLNIGIPYYLQFKITEDTLPSGIGVVLPGIQAGKSWAIGLGAEVALAWSASDALTVRWVQGFAGANTTNGASFFVSYSHLFYLFGEEAH